MKPLLVVCGHVTWVCVAWGAEIRGVSEGPPSFFLGICDHSQCLVTDKQLLIINVSCLLFFSSFTSQPRESDFPFVSIIVSMCRVSVETPHTAN